MSFQYQIVVNDYFLCFFRKQQSSTISEYCNSRVKQCTIAIGVHPPRTCSSLKNNFSAPNDRTDMKIFVYDPNTSKNNWEFKKKFFIKNWQNKYNKQAIYAYTHGPVTGSCPSVVTPLFFTPLYSYLVVVNEEKIASQPLAWGAS